MPLIRVSIPNWAKFNPRADRTNHVWFRMQNTFFHDQAVFTLSDSQRCLYLFFLCECSKKDSGEVEILASYIAAILGRKESEIIKDFNRLISAGLLADNCRHEAVIKPSTVLTTEQTNNTDKQDNTIQGDFDFESLYKKYPRKLGKSEGLKKLAREVQSQDDFDAVARAIDRYARYCREKGTEEKFIKHFSSFMSTWRDWLDPNTGKGPGSIPIIPENPRAVAPLPAEHTPMPKELFRGLVKPGAA